MEERKADVILSDMAPKCTGHQSTDHLRSMVLAEAAFETALEHLSTGGHFVTKLFQGRDTDAFTKNLRQHFEKVAYAKPEASRKDSVEVYAVALHFKGKTIKYKVRHQTICL